MASRFAVPDSSPPSSPAPATPAKYHESGRSLFGHEPSTTPAGPPPSSAPSFTPVGAPSDSFMSSSVMRGFTGQKPPSFGNSNTTNRRSTRSTNRSTFDSNAPLGRSIRGKAMQPSGLSRQVNVADEEEEDAIEEEEEEDEEEEDAEGEDDYEPLDRGSLFRTAGTSSEDLQEIEQYIERDMEGSDMEEEDDEEEEHAEGESEADENTADLLFGIKTQPMTSNAEMFLNMRPDDRAYDEPMIEEEEDLLMLHAPSATNRIQREAESMFRKSSLRLAGSTRDREFSFASIARDLYKQGAVAELTESAELILKTEDLVCRLYSEGVGPQDDVEKLDNSLASTTARLVMLWNDYADQLPEPQGEEFASIGPSEQESTFAKASWIAGLMLRMHHTRWETNHGDTKAAPLPEILFDWQEKGGHNLQPDQVRLLLNARPSPASRSLFWQVLRSTLIRGDTLSAARLLRNAGWEHATKGHRGEKAYTGRSLETVRHFAARTAEVLETCPASSKEWDIWDSNWTLFRIKAKAELDRMTLFAEGKTQRLDDDAFETSMTQYDEGESISTMARKAASQLPWDIYENLQTIYSIIRGQPAAIMDTAQDWCEATVGLFGWWDDSGRHNRPARLLSASSGLRASGMPKNTAGYDYFERLASAFQIVVGSDVNPNAMNPVEIALASAFEGNINGVIGLLRTWSLPVACTVAEIASLGEWLPAPDTAAMPVEIDDEDFALLGISRPAQDEVEGIKDATLVLYARELAGVDSLSKDTDGWEMAINVLGRIDDPEKSEEIVGELLRDLFSTLDEASSHTVDKIWRILNDLGMITYAEETAEAFAEILSKESHRYGEALWYFALSHRTDQVRQILDLLTSYSLLSSSPYPPPSQLDPHLNDLLTNRTATLEEHANQDLEAAQLLGRMLSGYATLRKFFELRDSPTQTLDTKRKAAFCLVAVISSADDNIRGGLYDASRDAVVSEDFLLALLGEATAFINQPQQSEEDEPSPSLVTLAQLDILLKAIEDIETINSAIFSTCEDFFSLTLLSAQGLKGSSPADLMRKSTTSGSHESFVMTGSSVLASQLSKALGDGGKVSRGWDWRKGDGVTASTTARDVLRKLRVGIAKELARLWLEEADGGIEKDADVY